MRFFWGITLLSGIFGAVIIFFTSVVAKGAPQEAAGYAMACAVAIVPYIFTRSAQALFGPSPGESTKRIVDAIGLLYRSQTDEAGRTPQLVNVEGPDGKFRTVDIKYPGDK